MGPIEATIHCLRHPLTWRGRAGPGEYWWFALAHILVSFVYGFGWGLVSAMHPTGIPADMTALYPGGPVAGQGGAPLVHLALLAGHVAIVVWFSLAGIAVGVRRLHDSDRSGWWWWISLVPVVGVFILLVLLIVPGDGWANRFGPPPGGRRAAARQARRESDLPTVTRGAVDHVRSPEDLRALRHARMPQGVS